MRESDLWKYLRNGLIGKCHLTRIESSAGNGVPDVSIGLPGKNAWLELKYVKEWPRREPTKLRLPLRPEQKHWIKCRGELSGDVWVLCRVDNYFFLLDHSNALEATEGWTRADWFSKSSISWVSGVNFGELIRALKGDCDGNQA